MACAHSEGAELQQGVTAVEHRRAAVKDVATVVPRCDFFLPAVQELPMPRGLVAQGAHLAAVTCACSLVFLLCSHNVAPALNSCVLLALDALMRRVVQQEAISVVVSNAVEVLVSDVCAAIGVLMTLRLASRSAAAMQRGQADVAAQLPVIQDGEGSKQPPWPAGFLQKTLVVALACFCLPALSLLVHCLTGGQAMNPFDSADAISKGSAHNGAKNALLAYVPLLFVVAPVWEEALFRGFLLRGLLTAAGLATATTPTSASPASQHDTSDMAATQRRRLQLALRTAACIALSALLFATSHFAFGGTGGWTPPPVTPDELAVSNTATGAATPDHDVSGGVLFIPLVCIGALLGAVFVASGGDTACCVLVHCAWNAVMFVALWRTM